MQTTSIVSRTTTSEWNLQARHSRSGRCQPLGTVLQCSNVEIRAPVVLTYRPPRADSNKEVIDRRHRRYGNPHSFGQGFRQATLENLHSRKAVPILKTPERRASSSPPQERFNCREVSAQTEEQGEVRSFAGFLPTILLNRL